ncbi:DNA polymerase I [Desulfacinum hydrothermale DSM 13146]|uniref:DNA polymerase I n=1 Tax=Desulfacinum hydrothermale DSM 13146 TaxID=1121390 RepID=A0A1W1XLN6_9BACT|nr:DNA polymerase I [Desulfacinum hydrothermale]SMC24428.1 DNA polymerase I [Desulfacinum hydrothermale DSM 13146]
MTEKKPTLYLIDASSYMYRAFYAMGQRLTAPDGTPTQAVYGFHQMLQKVLKDKKPERVCVVYDPPGPTLRHAIYPDYKATRERMPEDLVVQVPLIKNLVDLLGIPSVEITGYEADDVIAALARKALQAGMRVVIISGDKDLHQLVREPHVIQWDPQKDEIFTSETVERKLGVRPEQVRDFLALMGDSSDNVPGVAGVGRKTAQNLLRQFGTLDQVLSRVEDIKSAAIKKKILAGKEAALLSRDLVTVREDAPVALEPDQCTIGAADTKGLVAFFQSLGFRRFLDELAREAGGEAAHAAAEGLQRRDRLVTDEKGFSAVLAEIAREDVLSIDLETTSTDAMRADLVGVALCWEDHQAAYIPVGHTGEDAGEQLSATRVLEGLRPFLEGERPRKVGQNIKYEWVVLKRHGVELQGIDFDTMVASYLLDPGNPSHRLERIVAEHLGESKLRYSDVAGSGKHQIPFAQVPLEKAVDYACSDAETTFRLVPVLREKLQGAKLENLMDTLERPLIAVLARMEHRGIRVDAARLHELSKVLEEGIRKEEEAIYHIAGGPFNIQSPIQLRDVLFGKLQLPVIKKTKTGPSTDMSVLEELAALHPIAQHIVTYRSLTKLKNTYVDNLPKLIHPETGRIHTSYNQAVTATGRLSSSDPNLQNIPIRTEEGRRIREAFVPEAGCVLLAADYSQIELRIFAHYSGDERLVAAFAEGADIHRRTAAEMFGVPPHEVTPEMRRQAKTINFGIIYGMGPYGLGKQLGISQAGAKAAIERYFATYEGVKGWIQQVVEECRERGYAETLLGRRRYLPELNSRNRNVRQQGERLAVNTTIQGTAADLIKKAMIDIDDAIRKEGLGTAMLLQVHDELVFEVPEDELDRIRALVRDLMENVHPLSVPLVVDMGWGANWAEAHA